MIPFIKKNSSTLNDYKIFNLTVYWQMNKCLMPLLNAHLMFLARLCSACSASFWIVYLWFPPNHINYIFFYVITICKCSRLFRACLVFGLSLGLPLGLGCVGSCMTRDRPVIGTASFYLFPDLIVCLLVDANDEMVFNAVLIFLIFFFYRLITSLILALCDSGAF